MLSEILIANILVRFSGDFKSWLTSRLLNKTIYKIVQTYAISVESESHGTRGIICYARCGVCNDKVDNMPWLCYHTDLIEDRKCALPYCTKWACKVSALKTMIKYEENRGKIILQKDWTKSNKVQIPRPEKKDQEGNIIRKAFESSGTAYTRWVHKINGKYYAHCDWIENGESLYKCVNIEDLGFKGKLKLVTAFEQSI